MAHRRTPTDEDFTAFAAGAYAPLLRTARLMTGNPQQAEDLVQSALERVYARWHRSHTWDSPYAYTREVLVNLLFKSAKRKWNGELPQAEPPDRVAPAKAEAESADHSTDRQDLDQALKSLPWEQRAVLVLRYYEDLSLLQTAQILNCTVGTVKSRTNRAVTALRASGALAAFSEEDTK